MTLSMQYIATVALAVGMSAASAAFGGKAPRVSFGEPVPSGFMPYLVDIINLNENDEAWSCTGSLLKPGWVLTSYGCVMDATGGFFVVKDKIIVPSTVTIRSPANIPLSFGATGNIAVLWAPELADLEGINYPRLATEGELDSAPVLVFAGYGRDENDQPSASGPNFISVQLDKTGDGAMFEPDHFVTTDDENQNACAGDGGGPLIIPSKTWADLVSDPEIKDVSSELTNEVDAIVGVHSYGSPTFNCSDETAFTAYVDLYFWKDWIDQATSEEPDDPNSNIIRVMEGIGPE
jgi:hypothetical protein